MRGLWELGESILEMEKGCGYREHGMLRCQRPVGWGAQREKEREQRLHGALYGPGLEGTQSALARVLLAETQPGSQLVARRQAGADLIDSCQSLPCQPSSQRGFRCLA